MLTQEYCEDSIHSLFQKGLGIMGALIYGVVLEMICHSKTLQFGMLHTAYFYWEKSRK